MAGVFSEPESASLGKAAELASRKSQGAVLTASTKEKLRDAFHRSGDADVALETFHSESGAPPDQSIASNFSANDLFDITRRTRQSTAFSQQRGSVDTAKITRQARCPYLSYTP